VAEMIKMKECPFCGNKGVSVEKKEYPGGTWYFASCFFCCARGPESETIRGAKYSWTSRHLTKAADALPKPPLKNKRSSGSCR
jgi:hypothetical protein